MNKLLKLAFLLGMLSLGFASCGDDEVEEIKKVPYTNWYETTTMEDGVTYGVDSGYIERIVDHKVTSHLDIEWPADVSGEKDLGYGEVEKYNAKYYPTITTFMYFDNKLLMLLNASYKYNLPGYAYLFEKDLSSYEMKEVICGRPYNWDDTKLAIFSYGPEYALYDSSFKTLAKGKADIRCFFKSYEDRENKIAFGKYKDEYYALIEKVYKYSYYQTCILNMTTEELTPLEIGSNFIDDIDYMFPEEEYKPRTQCTFSFNEDHFEVIYDVTYYSGEKGTIVRKFGLDGKEITD